MANDWIPWTKGLPAKTEVLRIAAELGVSRHVAACHCMTVWEWADCNVTVPKQGSDAYVLSVTPELLSEIVRIPGIGEAMAKAGWLLVDGEKIVFPNWKRWNLKSTKEAQQNRERQRRWRQQHQGREDS